MRIKSLLVRTTVRPWYYCVASFVHPAELFPSLDASTGQVIVHKMYAVRGA